MRLVKALLDMPLCGLFSGMTILYLADIVRDMLRDQAVSLRMSLAEADFDT